MLFCLQIVDRIEDPPSYIGYLSILGQKHAMYDADPTAMDQMGYMFLAAIQPVLEKEAIMLSRAIKDSSNLKTCDMQECWNDEVKDAWEHLFIVTIGVMRSAMAEELKR